MRAREKQRERESGNCFVVLVIRLSRCRPQRGAAEFKMRVAVNRVSVWCWCVRVCLLFLYACSDAAIENLSIRALGGVQEEARCSHVSNLPGFSPAASFPDERDEICDCFNCRIKS